MYEREKKASNLRVFGHLLHLLCSLWDGNRNSIGAGQSCVSGRNRVNNLTHTDKHIQTETDTTGSVKEDQ